VESYEVGVHLGLFREYSGTKKQTGLKLDKKTSFEVLNNTADDQIKETKVYF
jgi:hypothetical protein